MAVRGKGGGRSGTGVAVCLKTEWIGQDWVGLGIKPSRAATPNASMGSELSSAPRLCSDRTAAKGRSLQRYPCSAGGSATIAGGAGGWQAPRSWWWHERAASRAKHRAFAMDACCPTACIILQAASSCEGLVAAPLWHISSWLRRSQSAMPIATPIRWPMPVPALPLILD